MKNKILTSLMTLFMLCPIYAKGQTNAQILEAAENELMGLGCMAYQNTAGPGADAACRADCFRDEFGRDSDGWPRVYKGPQNRSANAIWWVGDSRTVGMYNNGIIAGENEAVLAKTAMGHDWLNGTALPKLRTCLCDGDTVILALGANDIWRHGTYIDTYQSLIGEKAGVTFWIVSVNPVSDGKTRYLKNSDIDTFNNRMLNAFADKYIDTYSVVASLIRDDCTDREGLHYEPSCGIEQKVYDTVMNKVNGS